MRKGLFWLL